MVQTNRCAGILGRDGRLPQLFLAGILCLGLCTALVGCGSKAGSDPTQVVTANLEAQRDNDYSGWLATLTPNRQEAVSKEDENGFGSLALTIDSVSVSPEETSRVQRQYLESPPPWARGWSKTDFTDNVIVVTAQYVVQDDQTREPMDGTAISTNFILRRTDKSAPWLIEDWAEALSGQ